MMYECRETEYRGEYFDDQTKNILLEKENRGGWVWIALRPPLTGDDIASLDWGGMERNSENLVVLAVTLPLAYGTFVKAIRERVCRSYRNWEGLRKVFFFFYCLLVACDSRYRSPYWRRPKSWLPDLNAQGPKRSTCLDNIILLAFGIALPFVVSL